MPILCLLMLWYLVGTMSSCLHAVPKNRCGSICRSHLSEKLLPTTASRARVVDHHTMVITCSSRKRANNHFHFQNTSFLYTVVHQNAHPHLQHCMYSTKLVDVYSFEIVAERWNRILHVCLPSTGFSTKGFMMRLPWTSTKSSSSRK